MDAGTVSNLSIVIVIVIAFACGGNRSGGRVETGSRHRQAVGGLFWILLQRAASQIFLGGWIVFTEINWGRPAFAGFPGQSLSQLVESETKAAATSRTGVCCL